MMGFYDLGDGDLQCSSPFVRIDYDGAEVLIDDQLTLEELEEIVAKMKELRAKNGNQKTSI